MNQTAIFAPFLATMLLTLIVWFYMYAKRIPLIHCGVGVRRISRAAQRGALHGQHRHVSILALLHLCVGVVVHGAARGLARALGLNAA